MNRIFILAAIFVLPCPLAHAALCDVLQGAEPARVNQFTNYAPGAGGINGHCGTSAKGYDACKFFLEDHLAGKSNAVMGATPQKGGTSYLFGGVYKGVALERSLGISNGCVRVLALDHYATKSNGKSKMDIVTKAVKSNITQRVNRASGLLVPIGRAWIERSKAARKIARNVQAIGEVGDDMPEAYKNANALVLDGQNDFKVPDSENVPVPTPRPDPNEETADTGNDFSTKDAATVGAALIPVVQQVQSQKTVKRSPASSSPAKQPLVYNPQGAFTGTTSDDLIPDARAVNNQSGISKSNGNGVQGPAQNGNIQITLPPEEK